MTSQPRGQAGPPAQYVDRPEIAETFADTIRGIVFDGINLRVEFCVSRMEPTSPGQPPAVRQVTVSRLVMPWPAAVALLAHLKQIEAANRTGQAPTPYLNNASVN